MYGKLHDFVIWEYFTHQKAIIHILTQLGNALQIHARYAAIYHGMLWMWDSEKSLTEKCESQKQTKVRVLELFQHTFLQ